MPFAVAAEAPRGSPDGASDPVAPVRVPVAAGVPLLGNVLYDGSSFASAADPVRTPDELAKVMARAAEGHSGPILVISDGARVRLLELRR